MKPVLSGCLYGCLLLLLVIIQCNTATGQTDSSNEDGQCQPGSKPFDKNPNQKDGFIMKGLKHWEGFVLIVAFGLFGLCISIVYRALRRCLYDDSQLLDTYFDAGGDVNFALLACAVIGRWFWSSGFTWSTASVYQFGLVGQFWHAAAGAAVLLLFTMAAYELRLKSPGAKTFLQVVYARFGRGPHIVLMIFALTLNIILSGAILMEACRILNSLHQDTNTTAICAVLALAIAASTLVGGVGGGVYLSYFTSVLISGISLLYVIHTLKDKVEDSGADSAQWGDDGQIYWKTCGLDATNKTKEASIMTFHSRYALMEGILIVLCGLSSVFVNQAFWTGAVVSRPMHTVWGYLCGAVAWFSLPFMLSLSFGFAYWTLASEEGKHIVSQEQARYGYLAVFASQRLLGNLGDYLFYTLTLAATISACSAEVLSISSILIYDIYQAYIGPRLSATDPDCPASSGQNFSYWNHLKQIDYLKYLIVIIVSIILFCTALILIAIDIDFPWIYKFLGVVCGSAVIPIIMAVGCFWTRSIGVFFGPILGLICGMVTWLVYAASFKGGLDRFRENTGRQEVFIAGAAMSLGAGGLVVIIMSIFGAACKSQVDSISVWAKTRLIDNPLRPWAAKYTGGIGDAPDFFTLQAILRPAEISAYALGPILAVGAMLVWPALMLLADDFSEREFSAWVWVAIIWGGIAGGLLALLSLGFWLIEICCNGTCAMYEYDDHVSTISDDVVSVHSQKYLTGIRRHQHRPVNTVGVITQPPVTRVVSAPAPVSTYVPRQTYEPVHVSSYAPGPVGVSTYERPSDVRGFRTSVDYVKPVTRYHTNHHYQDQVYNHLPNAQGSEIDYQMSRDHRFKTTINLDD